ncbi:MAG: hypothetical protein AAYR33_07495 [Acetobacteraceae bacterium]
MRYVSRFLITLVGTAALSGCDNPAEDAFNASSTACAAKFPVMKGRTVAGAQCLHDVVFTQGPAAFSDSWLTYLYAYDNFRMERAKAVDAGTLSPEDYTAQLNNFWSNLMSQDFQRRTAQNRCRAALNAYRSAYLNGNPDKRARRSDARRVNPPIFIPGCDSFNPSMM